jgi:hypothetical protein
MELLDIFQNYKNARLSMKFVETPYIQSLKKQFSSTTVSTTEAFSSRFSPLGYLKGVQNS